MPFSFAQGDTGELGEVVLAGLTSNFNYAGENESPDEAGEERGIETLLLAFLCVS